MLELSQIMTRDVVTVSPETTLREAAELLVLQHISGAPVVNGNVVVGVISAADILELSTSPSPAADAANESWIDTAENERGIEDDAPGSYYTDLLLDDRAEAVVGPSNVSREQDLLDRYVVDEIMTRPAIALGPHDSVFAAAELMQSRGIHRVLVVENGLLVGIVSALDVTRAVADHKLAEKAKQR